MDERKNPQNGAGRAQAAVAPLFFAKRTCKREANAKETREKAITSEDATNNIGQAGPIRSTRRSDLIRRLEQVGVGSRVGIYWPLDKRHYPATIVAKHARWPHTYHFLYDDGEQESFDLSNHKAFQILDDAVPQAALDAITQSKGGLNSARQNKVMEVEDAKSASLHRAIGSSRDYSSSDEDEDELALPEAGLPESKGVLTSPSEEAATETIKWRLISRAHQRMFSIDGAPLRRGDTWPAVKKKMKESGWTRLEAKNHGENTEAVRWLLPDGKGPREGGQRGIHYLGTDAEARKFVRNHFGWCGVPEGLPGRARVKKILLA